MDKKKVIELIEKGVLYQRKSSHVSSYKERAKNCFEEALDELQKPDWISVEEDLPDIDEKVLVCNEKIPYMWWDSSISSDVADIWKDEHGFLKEDHITHWRKIDKLEV